MALLLSQLARDLEGIESMAQAYDHIDKSIEPVDRVIQLMHDLPTTAEDLEEYGRLATPVKGTVAFRTENENGVRSLWLSFRLNEDDDKPKLLCLERSRTAYGISIMAVAPDPEDPYVVPTMKPVGSVSGIRPDHTPVLGISVGNTDESRRFSHTATGEDPCVSTGTQIMHLMCGLAALFRVQEIRLGDSATVSCLKTTFPLQLSIAKMILDRPGFYERFGFVFEQPDAVRAAIAEAKKTPVYLEEILPLVLTSKDRDEALCSIVSLRLTDIYTKNNKVWSAKKTVTMNDWSELMNMYKTCRTTAQP